MTLHVPKPARRTDVRTGHTYAIPVVREVPRPTTGVFERGW